MDMRLTAIEIVRFLRENRIENINESDCSNMINYYKGPSGSSQALEFQDFQAVVCPYEDNGLSKNVNSRPRIYTPPNFNSFLDPIIECELADLLEEEILFHRLLEKQK